MLWVLKTHVKIAWLKNIYNFILKNVYLEAMLKVHVQVLTIQQLQLTHSYGL